jgi:hypothetical protein
MHIKEILLTIAKRIGRVQTWIIFTFFYFVVMAPVALIFKLLADPLHLRPRASLWKTRVPSADPMVWGKAQS